jgi:hypothetical protein
MANAIADRPSKGPFSSERYNELASTIGARSAGVKRAAVPLKAQNQRQRRVSIRGQTHWEDEHQPQAPS